VSRPLRTLLFTAGSHGDVHPFIAIGREVQRRGGEAMLLSGREYQPIANSQRLRFLACGDGDSAKETIRRRPDSMHALRGPMVVLREVLAPALPDMLESLRNAIAEFKPDIVLAHQLCIGSRWICEAMNVPFASVTLAPCAWMNPNDVLSMTPFRSAHPTPRAVRFDVWVGRWFTSFAMDRPLNAVRRSLGLPSRRHLWFEELRAPCLNLGLWSPRLRPALAGDPPHAAIVGFPRFDEEAAPRETDPRLARFLAEGEPPLAITLGTAVSHARPDFHAIAAEAVAGLSCRTVLVTNAEEYAPASPPPNVLAVRYAPFSTLFAGARAVVHHGGIGTLAQACAAGVPTLITPAAHDQFDNAARVERLGLSRTLHLARVDAKRLREAISHLLEDAPRRAAAADFAASLQGEDGAAGAVDAITSHLERR
jgi:rhamnosyltransferase subunit B